MGHGLDGFFFGFERIFSADFDSILKIL